MPQPICIRSYHVDGYGHVNNARYLEFLEDARWALFEQYGLLPLLGDIRLVVTRVDIHYRRSAVENDILHSETRITAVRPRQLQLSQRLLLNNSGKSAVEADITLMPATTAGVTSLSAELRQQLNLLLEPAS